ncbi:MAG TPA: methyl-accepting chemotaxis protein [Acidobacteriaceae bacterium]|jgi:methyl-accepting chemotaxis protein|nr:methyl-accepting chemotaxis protein [Acidobacteriaceae bacterium]
MDTRFDSRKLPPPSSTSLSAAGGRITLKQKFRLLVFVAICGLSVMAGFWTTGERSRLLSSKEEQARGLVDLGYSTIAAQYHEEQIGALTEQQAQKNARDMLRVMRYGDQNYLWINDLRPVMVMHPFKPELEGHDLSNLKDPQGISIFVEFVRLARQNGGGILYYRWPRPGQVNPVKKLSYVREFQPWGWVIGTGTYVDDVNAVWFSSAIKSGAITLLCLAGLVAVSMNMTRSIFGRLNRLTAAMRDIAQGEGDLTRRIPIEAEDEIAVVAQWFNRFMDSLHGIISRVAADTARLNTAAADIASAAGETASGSREQSGQLTQVANAMEEMSATVSEVSANSSKAAEDARNAVDLARRGGEIVQTSLARMDSIAASVGATARTIEELGKRSDQIGAIIAAIEDIAGQTNLLALNAAIEAARAGQHGRGFAVVAGEVRNLAERTTLATREISTTIEAVQEETAAAVARMEEGNHLVELGVAETAKAGSSLREIITAAGHVGAMIAQIATSAAQQATAVSEVNRNVAHIAVISTQAENTVQQSVATSEDISGLAQDLNELVGRFRLNENEIHSRAPVPPLPVESSRFVTRASSALQRSPHLG